MQIILWRHAEAEDDAPTDMARRLTNKGNKQAEKMAAWLKAQVGGGIKHWRVIASPAIRAQQTAGALKLPFETIDAIAPEAAAAAVLLLADTHARVVGTIVPRAGGEPSRLTGVAVGP